MVHGQHHQNSIDNQLATFNNDLPGDGDQWKMQNRTHLIEEMFASCLADNMFSAAFPRKVV